MAELTDAFGGPGRRGPKVSLGSASEPTKLSMGELRRQQAMADNSYGYDINAVRTMDGADLPHTIVGTLMRIDLPAPLASGESTEFTIEWAFNIVEEDAVVARSGYEHFPDDPRKGGNDIFLLAQWFPRMVAYSDYEGWHNKEFLGRGEFTLEFGDYEVEMTVPDDHIVASTGVLQNPDAVLTAAQRQRIEAAKSADAPMFIVTPEEAAAAERGNPRGTKTWQFSATNVRDFAWASSRKFMWDAQGHKQPGAEHETVLAMSFWPKEGGELWRKYSTAAVVHTMKVYSRFSFDYPYPTAQSVNGPVGGMEYPMIHLQRPAHHLEQGRARAPIRCRKKVFLVGVVIHEIGHIYFPMTVNSDERQWTWMDEGLNSFLDSVAGYEWDPDMPWTRSLPRDNGQLYGVEPAGTDHDPVGFGHQSGRQCLWQAVGRLSPAARYHHRARTVRFWRSRNMPAAGSSSGPTPADFLPHHRGSQRHRSRLVLARMVLHHRSCRYFAGFDLPPADRHQMIRHRPAAPPRRARCGAGSGRHRPQTAKQGLPIWVLGKTPPAECAISMMTTTNSPSRPKDRKELHRFPRRARPVGTQGCFDRAVRGGCELLRPQFLQQGRAGDADHPWPDVQGRQDRED